jgi:hypothetical protein
VESGKTGGPEPSDLLIDDIKSISFTIKQRRSIMNLDKEIPLYNNIFKTQAESKKGALL